MRKILFIILFFISSVFLFGESYYRSNSIGMIFESIPIYRLDEFDWTIEITKEHNVEKRILFFKSEEVELKEYISDGTDLLINTYTHNILSTVQKFHEGILLEEYLYGVNEEIKKYIYTWESEQLSKVSLYKDDQHIYDDLYITQPSGRLQQVRRLYSDSKRDAALFLYSDDKLLLEWFGSNNNDYIYNYDNNNISLIETWEDNKIIRTVNYVRNENGKQIIENDLINGSKIIKEFNLDDLLLNETSYTPEGIRKINYKYDNNLLVEKLVAASGIRNKYLYYYNEENNLIKELLFKENILSRETFYDSGEKTEENIYKNNNLLLKIFYKNGEIFKEEYF